MIVISKWFSIVIKVDMGTKVAFTISRAPVGTFCFVFRTCSLLLVRISDSEGVTRMVKLKEEKIGNEKGRLDRIGTVVYPVHI